MQEITDKEVELDKMKDQLIEKEDLLDELIGKSTAELERIAGMTAEEGFKQAEETLLESEKKIDALIQRRDEINNILNDLGTTEDEKTALNEELSTINLLYAG